MRTKLVAALCALAISFACVSPCAADQNDPLDVVADVVLVRPFCLAATAIGSVFFIATLPIAAISRSVKTTARTMVVKPAKATFTRPLGDVEALMD